MIKKIEKQFRNFISFRRYLADENGVSVVETAIFFPILISLLMGVFDIGQGFVINQKTVSASQVIADLVTRNEAVDEDIIADIVEAGKLAIAPYPIVSFGYDVASVEFDEDGDPVVLWRETDNMAPDDDAVDSTTNLGDEGDSIVVVSVVYQYEPFFSHSVIGTIDMNERAFLRGRKSATVICTDCP